MTSNQFVLKISLNVVSKGKFKCNFKGHVKGSFDCNVECILTGSNFGYGKSNNIGLNKTTTK